MQVLACNYLPHGYWFYVSGLIPEHKIPELVDRKLIDKYGIAVSRQTRLRRKKAGQANIQYVRFGRYWLLLATQGAHHFFALEQKNIRDVRKIPILFEGYSISVKRGGWLRRRDPLMPRRPDKRLRVRVQISRDRYADLKAYFLSIATRCSETYLARELFRVAFEPYARIRQQMLNILRLINRARHESGQDRVTTDAIRCRRRIVKPFEREEIRRELPDDRRIDAELAKLARTRKASSKIAPNRREAS